MLTLASLLLRALVPLGYMPGNVLAGEFVVLYPVGLSADIVWLFHAEHGAHHEQLIDMDAGCPIDTALQAAALPTPPAIPSITTSRPWVRCRIEQRRVPLLRDPRATVRLSNRTTDGSRQKSTDAGIGMNWAGQGGLKGYRIALEYSVPLRQDVDGPQLETDSRLMFRLQKSF